MRAHIFPLIFENENMIYRLDKSQCLGYLNGIFMIIFFRWLYFGGVYIYVCVRASVARISFYLLRHSIMLRWSYIIHLPLVWRQHRKTQTETHSIRAYTHSA